MTLYACVTYTYICLMFVAPVLGILKVFDFGLSLSVLLYLAQLFVYGYGGGLRTFEIMREWTRAK